MRITMAAGTAALALATAACGGSSGQSGQSGAQAGDLSPDRPTPVTVGYVPYADDVALFLAKENGIFRKHGLDATLTPVQAPTAAVASMVSGQMQFGFTPVPVLINANANGTPIKCVSTVDGRQTSDPKNDGTALVAAKGSGIASVQDLAGKKVAVVQLASLNAIDVKALALDAGMDPESIKLIQLPFPQMPAALAQGRVDAAVVVSPFLKGALDNGAQVVTYPNQALWPGGTVACFSAATRYLGQNPKVVKAFSAAMTEATLYARDHQDAAKTTLEKYLDLSAADAQKQTLSVDFDPTLDRESIQKIGDYMKRLGLIKEPVKPAELVWEDAK